MQIPTINHPHAYMILKGLAEASKRNSASMFLNSCMRIGARRLNLPFVEGVILASYAIWLEKNPDKHIGDFFGTMDYGVVFGPIIEVMKANGSSECVSEFN